MSSKLSDKIAEYERLLQQVREQEDSEGKVLLEVMLKRLIRTEEIADYRQKYFNNGYYFGFILMQSQVYEFALKNLIQSCEELIDLKALSFSKYDYKWNKLEKLTLGDLIDRVLIHYIEYPVLLEELRKFNLLRKNVVHQLVGDLDMELIDLEREIKLNHLTDFYFGIERLLHACSAIVNGKIGDIKSPQNPYVIAMLNKLSELVPTDDQTIKFNFDIV